MCGIAGIVSKNPTMVQQNKLQLMGNALQHRGPDAEGFWMNTRNTVGFAHRRLAVIDLSEAATQPMHKTYASKATGTLNNKLSIVYNGEIYNYLELRQQLQKVGYHFTSNSDTEVLLALYDCYQHNCLEKIDGMFAFAIWNETTNQLFAARDRFGEKPFYYFFDGEQLLFASEMKALWAAGVPKEMNNSSLLNYLGAGLVSNPNNVEETFYKNIKKLPAAHSLQCSLQDEEVYINSYWNLKDHIQHKQLSETQAVEQLQFLLQQSVSRRLRSDVKVGTSLSGGLDSSSIVATIQLLQTPNTQQQSFSAVFPGFEKDESSYIQLVNKQFNIQGNTVTPTADDFINDFGKLLYHQEEPFQSSSIYAQYKVYELAKQQGVTVLLDGQGADEILAGYTKYYHWYWQELIRHTQFSLFTKEKKATLHNGHLVKWGLNNYAATILPKAAALQLSKRLKKQLQENQFLQKDFVEAHFNEASIIKPEIHNLTDILYYNTCFAGLEDLLRYADRNSMAHGREVRLPFLSHELVEFIFSMPSAFKIQNGYTKHLLRLAMNNFLPKAIVWRKDKVGFEPPQQQWMQHSNMLEQIVEAKKKLVNNGVLNKTVLQKANKPLAAHDEHNFDWWVLCVGAIVTNNHS